MKRLLLHGKYAVGERAYALVDDDVYPDLDQHRWKAKPNGGCSHVYAVRNVKADDGRLVTVRMHRVVLGYAGPLDVDHVNRNALDNQRSNLRVVSRSENAKNRGRWENQRLCPGCGQRWTIETSNNADREMVCKSCAKDSAKRALDAANAKTCAHCSRTFVASRSDARFCSESCRKKAKRVRHKKTTVACNEG